MIEPPTPPGPLPLNPNPVAGALPPGTRLHEYRIVQVLGKPGGFGITYLAVDTNLEKQVAIKEYLPIDFAIRLAGDSVSIRSGEDRAAYDWGMKSFLNEARILSRFKHPNLVQVYRLVEANNTAYIVMEYVNGTTLSEHLDSRESLNEAELKSILLKICDGLSVVHEANILHRDIKPLNVMLRPDSTPVLIDFGAARNLLAAHTQTTIGVLTAGYSPIEQYAEAGQLGPWTDIYALGAVAYQAITGKKPLDATNRLGNDPLVTAVTAGAGRYDTAFLAAIDWALRMRSDQRPQRIADWRAAICGEIPVPGHGSDRVVLPKADSVDFDPGAFESSAIDFAATLVRPRNELLGAQPPPATVEPTMMAFADTARRQPVAPSTIQSPPSWVSEGDVKTVIAPTPPPAAASKPAAVPASDPLPGDDYAQTQVIPIRPRAKVQPESAAPAEKKSSKGALLVVIAAIGLALVGAAAFVLRDSFKSSKSPQEQEAALALQRLQAAATPSPPAPTGVPTAPAPGNTNAPDAAPSVPPAPAAPTAAPAAAPTAAGAEMPAAPTPTPPAPTPAPPAPVASAMESPPSPDSGGATVSPDHSSSAPAPVSRPPPVAVIGENTDHSARQSGTGKSSTSSKPSAKTSSKHESTPVATPSTNHSESAGTPAARVSGTWTARVKQPGETLNGNCNAAEFRTWVIRIGSPAGDGGALTGSYSLQVAAHANSGCSTASFQVATEGSIIATPESANRLRLVFGSGACSGDCSQGIRLLGQSIAEAQLVVLGGQVISMSIADGGVNYAFTK